MARIGYVPEIQQVKQQLETLEKRGLYSHGNYHMRIC